MMDYEALKALAKELKRPVPSLIALARNNDPFYVGTEQDKRDGAWFRDLWQRFGYTTGVHIRRMHYAIVSQNPPVNMPNGTPYKNTESCWKFLTDAAKAARYLEYVDPGAFVDRRNEDPINWLSSTKHEAEISIEEVQEPGELALSFPAIPDYSLDTFTSPQRYHLEMWCEKSTMNDIFRSLLMQYKAVLVYGKGELSITMALDAIRRFQRSGKAVRIFYVSDFDPAGIGMPVSMARKLEYFLRKLDLDIDVKLFPVVLTSEQVKFYTRLLPTPIKDSELRKAKFEQRFGNGNGENVAVELDALEALYPGELARILRREMERYYDSDLWRRVEEEEERIKQELEEARDTIYDLHREELDELEQEEEELQAIFDEQLKDRMARHMQRRYELSMTIKAELEEAQPDITEEDTPEADEAEEREDALFDSSRDYLEQNDVYQAHKGNGIEEDEVNA